MVLRSHVSICLTGQWQISIIEEELNCLDGIQTLERLAF